MHDNHDKFKLNCICQDTYFCFWLLLIIEKKKNVVSVSFRGVNRSHIEQMPIYQCRKSKKGAKAAKYGCFNECLTD